MCADADVIGAPFYLTSRLRGKVPVTSLPQPCKAGRRRRYGLRLAETLAGIHRVDLEAIGLDQLGGSAGYLERQISRHLRLWEHNRTRELDAVAWLADWLAANLPASARPRSSRRLPPRERDDCRGSARTRACGAGLGARHSRRSACGCWLSVRAMARIGRSPEHPLERGPVTRGEGSLTRAGLLSHYAAVSGRSVDGHGWYEVLALWRAAIFTEGNFRRAALGATDTPFLRNAGEHAQRLARPRLPRSRVGGMTRRPLRPHRGSVGSVTEFGPR